MDVELRTETADDREAYRQQQERIQAAAAAQAAHVCARDVRKATARARAIRAKVMAGHPDRQDNGDPDRGHGDPDRGHVRRVVGRRAPCTTEEGSHGIVFSGYSRRIVWPAEWVDVPVCWLDAVDGWLVVMA